MTTFFCRIAQDHGIQPVKIGHPLDGLTHVLLYKRMPYLSEASCHLSVLLYENSYSDFGDDINPLVVSELTIHRKINSIPFPAGIRLDNNVTSA